MSTFNGKITEITEIKTGQSNGKDWASLDFEVTEANPNNPQYPQIGLFSFFKSGDFVSHAKDFNNNFKLGDLVNVDFNLKRIDYKKDGQDRKFYKTEAWKVAKADAQSQAPQPAFEPAPALNEEQEDSLPF